MSAATKPTERPHNFALSGIPNDRAGRAVVAAIRKHLNRDRFQLRVRGNGPRTEAAKKARKNGERVRGNFSQDLPAKYAKTLRVYFDNKAAGLYLCDRIAAADARANEAERAVQVERDNAAHHLENLQNERQDSARRRAAAAARESELLRELSIARGRAAAEAVEEKNRTDQAVRELSAAVALLVTLWDEEFPNRIAAEAIVAKWGKS